MALEHLRSHGKSTIADAIRDIPGRSKDFLRSSLSMLAALDRNKWPTVISLAVDAFESSYAIDEVELAKVIDVSVDDAKYIINAASFIAAMLSAHPEATPQTFVDSLIAVSLLDADRKATNEGVLDFALVVSEKREALTEEFERSTLRNEVLPSLHRFETTIDIRFSVSESGAIRAVPVVLMMIDTDAEGQVIWYQVSKHQLKNMISQLERTLERVGKAEVWIDSKSNA
jgi:hypothetical protein